MANTTLISLRIRKPFLGHCRQFAQHYDLKFNHALIILLRRGLLMSYYIPVRARRDQERMAKVDEAFQNCMDSISKVLEIFPLDSGDDSFFYMTEEEIMASLQDALAELPSEEEIWAELQNEWERLVKEESWMFKQD